jgi:hypothetical protein
MDRAPPPAQAVASRPATAAESPRAAVLDDDRCMSGVLRSWDGEPVGSRRMSIRRDREDGLKLL